jgi:hypothetical protein
MEAIDLRTRRARDNQDQALLRLEKLHEALRIDPRSRVRNWRHQPIRRPSPERHNNHPACSERVPRVLGAAYLLPRRVLRSALGEVVALTHSALAARVRYA